MVTQATNTKPGQVKVEPGQDSSKMATTGLSEREQMRVMNQIEKGVEGMINGAYRHGLKEKFEAFAKDYLAQEDHANHTLKDAFLKFAQEQGSNFRIQAGSKIQNFNSLSVEKQNEIIAEKLAKRLENHRSAVLRKDIPDNLKDGLVAAIEGRLTSDAAYQQKMKEGAVAFSSLNSGQVLDAINTLSKQGGAYSTGMQELAEKHKPVIGQLMTAQNDVDTALTNYNQAVDNSKKVQSSKEFVDAKKSYDDAVKAHNDAKLKSQTDVNTFFATGAGKDLPKDFADKIKSTMTSLAEGTKAEFPSMTEDEYDALSADAKKSYLAYSEATKNTGLFGKLISDVNSRAATSNQKLKDLNGIISGSNKAQSDAAAELANKRAALKVITESDAYKSLVNDAAVKFKELNVATAMFNVTDPKTGQEGSELHLALNGKGFASAQNQQEYVDTKNAFVDYLNKGIGQGIFVPELEAAIKEGREPNTQLIEDQLKAAGIKGEQFKANKRASNIAKIVFSGQLEEAFAEYDAEQAAGRIKEGQNVRHDGNYSQGGHYGVGVARAMRYAMENGTVGDNGRAMNAEQMSAASGMDIDRRELGAVYGSIDEGKTKGLNQMDLTTAEGKADYMKAVDQFGLLLERQTILANGEVFGISVGDMGDTRNVGRSRTVAQTAGVVFGSHNFLTRILPGAIIVRAISGAGRSAASSSSGGGNSNSF